ncbi:MAG TPA: hypothetical protein PK490_05420 [Prosthecobacter sp.]|nr:hypothetical protein [Prosthecobacter sp.]
MPFSDPSPQMPTTHWSLIARLKGADSREARAALDDLCRAYHYPLYCQIRRHGLSHHDAEDVLQEFLLKLLRLDTFGIADAEKGRLRTFLLVALRRFLSNWRRECWRRQEREVSRECLEHLAGVEQRFQLDAEAHRESPDRLYDRQWARELMSRVVERLRVLYERKGREAVFEALRPGLLQGGSLAGLESGQTALSLGLSAGALRTSFNRLLEDYREALRAEILQTVESRELAKAEYEELAALFSQG